jgi:hypothetical protein
LRFHRRAAVCAPHSTKYSGLAQVRKFIKSDVPSKLPSPQKAASLAGTNLAHALLEAGALLIDFVSVTSLDVALPNGKRH